LWRHPETLPEATEIDEMKRSFVKGVGKKLSLERSSQKYFSQKGAFLTIGLEENKKRLEKKEF